MRVLHLLKTSVGASWALRQVRELIRLGVEIHVALPPGGPLIESYHAAGVQVHLIAFDFPLTRPWRIPAAVRALRNLVDKVQPDLIHSHFVATTLLMRLALWQGPPIPRIFQVPGPLHLEHLPFNWIEPRFSQPQDVWIGACHWTCEAYRRQGIPAERVFLSHYGIDLAEISPQPRGSLRTELGLAEATPIVGMVAYMYAPKAYLGQWRGLKGHEDLIDAVALLRPHWPELRLIFVGGAWAGAKRYEQRVRAYANNRLGEAALFLGHRQDIPRLYADFDLAVHPSHSENLGGAAESLALGIPTIATAVGGFPDIVTPGETGWLVPPHDPQRLAAAIEEALSHPDEGRQMALEGQRRTRRLLDQRRLSQEIYEIYLKLLGPSD